MHFSLIYLHFGFGRGGGGGGIKCEASNGRFFQRNLICEFSLMD